MKVQNNVHNAIVGWNVNFRLCMAVVLTLLSALQGLVLHSAGSALPKHAQTPETMSL
jgi:hypothetical protein